MDIDIHHGDGVEGAFICSPSVLTLSFHRYDLGFFPGTGTLGDIGFGQGLCHSVNVPLRAGLSGEHFLSIFTQVVDSVAQTYSPDAIVMQCGVDGMAGDPLRGNWNLDVVSIGRAVKHVLSLNKSTLLLGGGGYEPTLASRCWTYCTAVALNVEETLPVDIPEHDRFGYYGPDFTIFIDPCTLQDKNYIDNYSERVVCQVLKVINQLNTTKIEDLV